ncbi:MAG: sulfotransferase family 2 domain-containing protein [Nocardioides sp.]|uniref:sulfotransferase family 2 domain-containing protein n=1 Tax=Nocardioides sp. TaxID=35761 RepID=UPI0039E6011F
MPIFTKDDRAALFVHIPKTGGTSVERVIEGSGWRMHFRMTKRTSPLQFDYRRVTPQHYEAALLRATLRLHKFDPIFMVVRDPIARFRSEYAHRFRDPALGGAAMVEKWATVTLDRYADNPYVLDNHLRPQYEFQVARAAVYRLEDGLEAMFADLNDRFDLGIDAQPKRHLDSTADGRLASRDVELSPALLERLCTFYARDFEAFGYPVPEL